MHWLSFSLAVLFQVAAATVGLEGQKWVPGFEAHPAVIAFLQGGTLLGSTALSLLLLRKISDQSWRSLWPHSSAMVAFSTELWQLIV